MKYARDRIIYLRFMGYLLFTHSQNTCRKKKAAAIPTQSDLGSIEKENTNSKSRNMFYS